MGLQARAEAGCGAWVGEKQDKMGAGLGRRLLSGCLQLLVHEY